MNFSAAQSCNDHWLQESKLKLDTLIIAYKPISGLKLADSIIKLIHDQNLNHCEASFWIQYNQAELLELNSKFREALEIYYKLINLSEEGKNWPLLICNHISIARVMETIGRKEDCLRHLKLAFATLQEQELWPLYAFYCVRYSSYHRIFDNRDTAYAYAHYALSYSMKYANPRHKVDAFLLLGMLSAQLDSSIYYNKNAIRQFELNGDIDGAASMAVNLYRKLKQENPNAHILPWLDSIANYLHKIDEKNFSYHRLSAFYHEELAKNYKKNIQLDSAYYHLELSKDHLAKSKIDVNQSDVSQAEIEFITAAERLRTESLKKQAKIQQYILGLLIAGFIGALIFIYNIQIKKKKIEHQRILIQLQNEDLAHSIQKQSILLSEIHHRVKNNLQLVISLLTLHYNKVKDKDEYQYLEEISNKVRSIALIHEHLYNTGEFEKIELKSYLRDLLEHYLALHTLDAQFDYFLEAEDDIFLNLETVMPIGIICTELISNSLKYARHPEQKLLLDFRIQKLDSKYILKFQDNGNNIKSVSAYKSGMGTMLIESMVRQLQAQSSPILNGTSSFNLIFQEKKLSSL